MSGIFISYRRNDAAGWARPLQEALRREFPEIEVFYDIGSVGLGEDFLDAMRRALEQCEVVIVMIGPHWLDARDEEGHRRLDDPEDWVRLEVAECLRRRGLLVVPVLVGGAVSPKAAVLPEPLKALARRNAHEITDRRWEYDVTQLVAALRKVVIPPGTSAPSQHTLPIEPPPPAPEPRVARPAAKPSVQPPGDRQRPSILVESDLGLAAVATAEGLDERDLRLFVLNTIEQFVHKAKLSREITWPFGLNVNLSFDGNIVGTAILMAMEALLHVREPQRFSQLGVAVSLFGGTSLAVGAVGQASCSILGSGQLQRLPMPASIPEGLFESDFVHDVVLADDDRWLIAAHWPGLVVDAGEILRAMPISPSVLHRIPGVGVGGKYTARDL